MTLQMPRSAIPRRSRAICQSRRNYCKSSKLPVDSLEKVHLKFKYSVQAYAIKQVSTESIQSQNNKGNHYLNRVSYHFSSKQKSQLHSYVYRSQQQMLPSISLVQP